MTLSEIRERAWRVYLEFAWRQWAQVGVSANIASLDQWAIDPEALILFTISLGRRDPRLFDEVLDWLTINHHLLSSQRLRNLSKRFTIDTRLVEAVSAWASQSPQTRHLDDRGQPSQQVPVFSPEVLTFIGEPDPVFLEYGYIRPRAKRSGKSGQPDVTIPANFSFQLRNLFGPGSRAEVIRVLLTFADGPLDAARISDEAGYAKRNVNETLTSLSTSRVVKARWRGNERNFIAYRNKWASLLEIGPSAESLPRFVSWVNLLPASLEIIDWLDGIVGTEISDYLISSQARDLMERVAPSLGMAGLDAVVHHRSHGTAFLPAFMQTVDSLLTRIEASALV
jgi:hypothetical protein